MKGELAAALLLAPLAAGPIAPARADVVARSLQVSVDYAQRYGTGQPARTPSDARRRLYAEIAGECPRLETMSGLSCRIESVTMRSDERPGTSALTASVRFALRSRAEAARNRRGDEFRFERRPGGLF